MIQSMRGLFTLTGKVAGSLFLTVLLLGCFLNGTTVQAQTNPTLYQEIQLDKKSYHFDELTHTIQQQTGLTFSYNAATIASSKKIKVHGQRVTLIKLLERIQKESGISYRMVNGNHIIYFPNHRKSHYSIHRERRKSKAKKLASPEEISKTHALSDQGDTTVMPNDTGTTEEVYVIGDSLTAATYYFGGGGSGGGMGTINMVMRFPGSSSTWENPYASLNPPGEEHAKLWNPRNSPDISGFLKNNLLIRVGVSVDEIYYFNPTLQFGFRFLYATLSYNTGRFSQWRYGLGADLPINDQWSIQAGFNTGKDYSSAYTFPKFDTVLPPPDSLNPFPTPIITQTNIPISVQSKLIRFSVAATRLINKNMTVSAGFTINQLKSFYYSQGKPIDLNATNLPLDEALNQFTTLRPPYLLSNSYSASSASGVKVWIGFQLSFFYRFNFRNN